jgi:non-heme chloroperoxidase
MQAGIRSIAILAAWGLPACGPADAQDPSVWRDPSPHRVQFVTVSEGVQLEVLDWGGFGRPLVLLHGSGISAHNFDDFAPKIRGAHVYGITRRGHGRSTHAETGYDDQRLADDVLRVLDALKLEKPILAGHSMGGGELTTLGNQHSDRLGGLVYLDALADPRDPPGAEFRALQQKLPAEMHATAPPTPTPDDTKTFAAYRAWQQRTMGFAFPEGDLRSIFTTNPDGTMGRHTSPSRIFTAIGQGQKKRDYSRFRVPVLAFVEPPRRTYDPAIDRYQVKNDEERQAIEAANSALAVALERWSANLRAGVPDARIVELPGAGHYVFLTREAEVVAEIEAFLKTLVR